MALTDDAGRWRARFEALTRRLGKLLPDIRSSPGRDALRQTYEEARSLSDADSLAEHFDVRVDIEVWADNLIAGFGALDEDEVMLLNLRACGWAVADTLNEGESAHAALVDVIGTTVAHEVLHVVQKEIGATLDEAQVERALEAARAQLREAEDGE